MRKHPNSDKRNKDTEPHTLAHEGEVSKLPVAPNSTESSQKVVSQTARNSFIGVAFFLLTLLVQFFYRRYFIHVLGDDLLGLNGTLTSIINFLNIAELGLATAIGFSLYKPLVDGDKQTINEIISLQGWFYRLICLLIIGVSLILLFFFPSLLGDLLTTSGIPFWYAYATFGVLLANSLLGYIFNYRQILLFSDLQGYKVTIAMRGTALGKLALQILAFLYFKAHPESAYIAWLVIELVGAFVQTIWLELLIRRNYPWLKTNKSSGATLRHKYPAILKKTGQLFFHKIATFVVLMSTPLIIASVLETQNALYMVAVYQNYYVLFSAASGIVVAIYSAFTPTIGKLKAIKTSEDRIELLFRSTLLLRILMAMTISLVILFFSKELMQLWVGGERYFTFGETLLFSLYCYLQLSRNTEPFTEAYGMFQDVWAPLVEAFILIAGSLYFGSLWGLSGIFLGMNLSAVAIIHLWKPYFLYHYGFRKPTWLFYRAGGGLVLVMIGMGILLGWLKGLLFGSLTTIAPFLLVAIGWTLLYLLCTLLVAYLLLPDFRKAILFVKEKSQVLLQRRKDSPHKGDETA